MERDRYVSSSTAAAAAGNTERKHRSRSDKRVVSHSHGSFMRTNSNCSNISTLSTSVTTTNTTHINYNEDSHKSNTTGGHASSHKHPHHFEQREKEDEDHKIEMKELTESEIQKTHLHASLTGQNKANELKGKLDEIKLMEQIHKMEEEYAHLYGLYTSQQEQLQGMSTLREEAKLLKLQKANTDECSGSNGELGKYKELLCRINDELCAVHDLSVGADESKLQARLHVNANMGERVSAKKLHKGINSKSNINAVSDELQTHILHISQRLRLLILSERNKRQTIQSMNSELEDLKQKYTEVSKCNNSSSSGSITDKCNSNNTNNMVNSTLSIQEKQHLLSKIEHCMSERDEAINAQTQTQQKLETVQYQLERSSRRNGTLQREVEKMKRQLSESERK